MIECALAVEGNIILKIWLILRVLTISSFTSLSTSKMEYGDMINGFFSILHILPHKFW